MCSRETEPDRLTRFKQEMQWKLETDIARVGELALFAKLHPDNCQWLIPERAELELSIPRLRDVIEYIQEFERDCS